MNYKTIFKAVAGVTMMTAVLQACHASDARILPPVSHHKDVVTIKPVAHTMSNHPAKTSNVPNTPASYLMGKFDPASKTGFVRIPRKYADRSGLYLREEALEKFIKMRTAAKKAGVHLVIRSATRNFDYQKGIWERKWLGKTKLSNGINVARDIVDPMDKSLHILEYSSMPGTSRHHWGTDIDLNSFNNKWFQSGKGLKLFQWMNANAAKYGFHRPYTAKGAQRPNGYNEEKWHWSYTPLAKKMTQDAERVLDDSQITGFLGSETAEAIGVVQHYILGVHPSCR